MRRKTGVTLAGIFGAAASLVWWVATPQKYDYLISEVRYLRGQAITDDRYSVGIRGERIVYVGKEPRPAKHHILGNSKILAPGFLDTNACAPVDFRGAGLKIQDGVTAYLLSHGGPPAESAMENADKPTLNYGITVGVPHFIKQLKYDPNFDLNRALAESLARGAYGISLSPEYNSAATPSFIDHICRYFAHSHTPISFHARYSSRAEELSGLDEVLRCAAQGNPIHLLHLSSTGATYHPEAAYARIEKMRRTGIEIIVDFYPYSTWASYLTAGRFSGDWLQRYGVGFDAVSIPGRIEKLNAAAFDDLRQKKLNPLISVEGIPWNTVDFFALRTDAFIGTDSPASRQNIHPRGAGSFAKFYERYVKSGKITFAEMLYRFSTAAYEKFAPYLPELKERGKISEGYYADLVLWDETEIKSRATLQSPLTGSSGVVAAFVNGTPRILDGKSLLTAKNSGHFLSGVRR